MTALRGRRDPRRRERSLLGAPSPPKLIDLPVLLHVHEVQPGPEIQRPPRTARLPETIAMGHQQIVQSHIVMNLSEDLLKIFERVR